MDLKDTVPARERMGWRAFTEDNMGGSQKNEKGGQGGEGLYVFLQSTDTQKMPAARKQADMIR